MLPSAPENQNAPKQDRNSNILSFDNVSAKNFGFNDAFLSSRTDNFFDLFYQMGALDTFSAKSRNASRDIPTTITGTYREDYNINYIDSIIRKKLSQEKYTRCPQLKAEYEVLRSQSMEPQNRISRDSTLRSMEKTLSLIQKIESGSRLAEYEEKTRKILKEYRLLSSPIKTISFEQEEKSTDHRDENFFERISLIEKYLDIAGEYISINVTRTSTKVSEECVGCGKPLGDVAETDEGTIRCPSPECNTEHTVILLTKFPKDEMRLGANLPAEDESIDNFIRAFTRYQGLQQDIRDDSLYEDLDEYFKRYGRPSGEEVRKLPLNAKGRRGDTNHKMLWDALSHIGRGLYEDANLIGHNYWGWELPYVMPLKERIIEKYNKTQKVFYQIPPEERCRVSSLGTQYRLWRHLQLEGHPCSMDEFRIAENPQSLLTHNKLWRLMCERAGDPNIRYIS